MRDELARVKRAARAKRRADDAYRAALLEAAAALEAADDADVYAQLAAAAGVSRQSARVMVTRAMRRAARP